MYCTSCGIEIPEDARFCSGCGKPTSPTPESSASVDVESEKPKKKEWKDLNFKEKSVRVIFVAVVVCAFLLLCIGVIGKACGVGDNPSTKEGKSVSMEVK